MWTRRPSEIVTGARVVALNASTIQPVGLVTSAGPTFLVMLCCTSANVGVVFLTAHALPVDAYIYIHRLTVIFSMQLQPIWFRD